MPSSFEKLRQWDDARPSFPGEHWIVFGAGLLLLARGGKSTSLLGRMATRAVGTALVARAATGRDGVIGHVARVLGAAPVPAEPDPPTAPRRLRAGTVATDARMRRSYP